MGGRVGGSVPRVPRAPGPVTVPAADVDLAIRDVRAEALPGHRGRRRERTDARQPAPDAVINETTGAAGQIVRTVRDDAGRLIQYTLDSAGNVTGART